MFEAIIILFGLLYECRSLIVQGLLASFLIIGIPCMLLIGAKTGYCKFWPQSDTCKISSLDALDQPNVQNAQRGCENKNQSACLIILKTTLYNGDFGKAFNQMDSLCAQHVQDACLMKADYLTATNNQDAALNIYKQLCSRGFEKGCLAFALLENQKK